MSDDQDLGDGPGPMTFGRLVALTVAVSAVLTLALVGLMAVLS